MKYRSKLGLSTVITLSLLIIVSIISLIGLQNWFSIYQNELMTDIEQQALGKNAILIEKIQDNKLYVINKAEHDITVNQIKINSINCESTTEISKGINEISLDSCQGELNSNVINVVIITGSRVYSKSLYIPNFSLNPSYPHFKLLNYIEDTPTYIFPANLSNLINLEYNNNKIYGITNTNELLIFNAPSPDNMNQVATYKNPLLSNSSLKIHNNYVYTYSKNNINIINITDTNNIIIEDTLSIDKNPSYIYITEKTLFLGYTTNITIINITDKTNIEIINTITTQTSKIAVDDSRDILFVNNMTTISAYNITDLNNINFLNSFSNNAVTTEMILENDYLYTQTIELGETFSKGNISIINTSDINNMNIIGTFENIVPSTITWQDNIHKNNNYLYVLHPIKGLNLSEMEEVLSTTYNLTILNISNPTNINKINSIKTDLLGIEVGMGGKINTFFEDGLLYYIRSDLIIETISGKASYKITTYNITNPNDIHKNRYAQDHIPDILLSYNNIEGNKIYSLDIPLSGEEFLLMMTGEEIEKNILKVYDIKNNNNLEYSNSYTVNNTISIPIKVENNFLYNLEMSFASETGDTFFTIYQKTDSELTQLDRIVTKPVTTTEIYNNILFGYDNENDSKLYSYNISNPNSITQITEYSGIDIKYSIQDENYIYATNVDTLRIYNKTDILNIQETDSFTDITIIDRYAGLDIHDNYLILINYEDFDISIFNITDKTNIDHLYTKNNILEFNTEGLFSEPTSYIEGNYMYLGPGSSLAPLNSSFVQIINISDILNISTLNYNYSKYNNCLAIIDSEEGPYGICNINISLIDSLFEEGLVEEGGGP